MNMSPSFAPSFADARPVAQHCAELIGTDRGPEEMEQLIASWRRDLGHDLAQELSQLFSGEKLHVSIGEPETLKGDDLYDRIGPIAVNCLLRCGEENQTMLLSLDFSTAVALTDCSFGGDGEMPMDPPSQLPRSAGLLAEQCAGMIAQTIARTAAQRCWGGR